jgi:hypothetical protein
MPAPQFLAILPKPILFGLYGAIGGLLGALVFGEPAWQILRPPPPPPAAQPEPQLAVAASKELQLLLGKENTFAVEIVRAAFDGSVDVKIENLPVGVTAASLTIAKGETTGKVTLRSSGSASESTTLIKVIASATPNGKTITAETFVSLQVLSPPAPQADVVFVLDVTGSMDPARDGIRDGIEGFAAQLEAHKIDFRIALVAFRDLTNPQDETINGLKLMQVLQFKDGPFTTDVTAFKSQVKGLVARGGGDDPESSLEAVATACDLKFRKSATKVLLLITDAPPKVKPGQNISQTFDEELAGAKKTAEVVKNREIDGVNLVVKFPQLNIYKPLMDAGLTKGAGQFFDFDETVNKKEAGFTSLLDKFTTSVVEAAAAKNPVKPTVAAQAEKPVLTTKSLQSSEQFTEGSQGRLMLMSAVWAGAIAALVCFALLAGQHHYLRGAMPSVGTIAVGLAGGLMAGLLGGACGYGLYWISPNEVFRVLGWSLLGGLAGLGLSLFIPNLKLIYGLAGGAMGGAAGGVGFILLSGLAGKLIGGTFGDVIGRLSGGLIVGLCIGLMVAIVEAAFRSAWLEVRYGARETITVNLGPEPVKIGGDNRACTVWARGAAPVALRYFIRGGQVVCEDTPNRAEAVARNGDSREVGNVTVTVRTGSSATPAGTPARKPSAAPPLLRSAAPAPPPPPPALKPLGLEFDDDPLPLPMSPAAPPRPAPAAAPGIPPRPASSVPPAAPPRPPVPTAGTKPAAPPPASPRPASSPPAAPKPPAGPRDPDACPSCGRKNPGRAGSRYCMLCDQTY